MTMAGAGGRFQGPTAACPHAAGFAAVLSEMLAERSPHDLRRMLLTAVRGLSARVPDPRSGYGLLDAKKVRVKAPHRALELPDEDSEVALPEEFGGAVTAAVLNEWLRLPQRHDEFAASVTTDRALYRVGETIDLRLRSSRETRCLLFARHDGGSWSVLGGSRPLRAGQTLALRPVATDPPGVEELMLFCSAGPVAWASPPQELPGSVAISRTEFVVEESL
jgi:hypothetical protein